MDLSFPRKYLTLLCRTLLHVQCLTCLTSLTCLTCQPYLLCDLVHVLEMLPEVFDVDVAHPTLPGFQSRKLFRFLAATHFPDPVDVSAPSDSVNIL